MKFEITQLPANEYYTFCRQLSTTVKTAVDMLNIVDLIETHTEYTTDFDWLHHNIQESFNVNIQLVKSFINVGNDVLFKCAILIHSDGKVITDEQGNEVVNAVLNYFLSKEGE